MCWAEPKLCCISSKRLTFTHKPADWCTQVGHKQGGGASRRHTNTPQKFASN